MGVCGPREGDMTGVSWDRHGEVDVMPGTESSGDDIWENCEECDRETPHVVTIRIRTESTKAQNRSYSRQPYRESECRRCGTETVLRNGA